MIWPFHFRKSNQEKLDKVIIITLKNILLIKANVWINNGSLYDVEYKETAQTRKRKNKANSVMIPFNLVSENELHLVLVRDPV